MTNPIIKIVNTSTGEEIEREMDSDELAQFEADEAKAQADANAAVLVASAKRALLEKLGITEEEAKLLLS